MYYIFIQSSVVGHIDCFRTLAIVNNVAMNIGLHVYFQINVFGWVFCLFVFEYIPSGISGSYGSYIFKFFEKSPYCLHTNLHSTFTNLLHTNLYSHQQCTRVPSSLYPHHYLLFAFLLMTVILISVR